MVREHPRGSSYIALLICAEFLCQTKRQRLIHDKNFGADKKTDARGFTQMGQCGLTRSGSHSALRRGNI
jgi:hypothetical protein